MGNALFFAMVNAWCYLRHPNLVTTFKRRLGYFPSIAKPRRYVEYFLWRKIFDHNPLFVACSDKLATKRLVSERCPDASIAPILWKGTDPSNIPDDILASGIVIKANHGTDWNIFVLPGGGLSPTAIASTRRWLRRTHGRRHGEWAYAPVSPMLFAEPLIAPTATDPVVDINVDCCDGEAVFCYVAVGMNETARRVALFGPDGLRLETAPVISGEEALLPRDFRLPPGFVEVKRLAGLLSAGFDQIRCDFMVVGEKAYFCEFTVYSAAGYIQHTDDRVERSVLAVWDLRKSWFLTAPQSGWRKLYAQRLRTVLGGEGKPRVLDRFGA